MRWFTILKTYCQWLNQFQNLRVVGYNYPRSYNFQMTQMGRYHWDTLLALPDPSKKNRRNHQTEILHPKRLPKNTQLCPVSLCLQFPDLVIQDKFELLQFLSNKKLVKSYCLPNLKQIYYIPLIMFVYGDWMDFFPSQWQWLEDFVPFKVNGNSGTFIQQILSWTSSKNTTVTCFIGKSFERLPKSSSVGFGQAEKAPVGELHQRKLCVFFPLTFSILLGGHGNSAGAWLIIYTYKSWYMQAGTYVWLVELYLQKTALC